MMPLLFARWIALRVARHPLSWMGVALLVSIWPITAALAPIGLATSNAIEARALYEVAFLACLTGSVAALAALRSSRPLLEPLSPPRRAAAEGAAHLAVVALFLAPPLAAAWAVGAPPGAFRPGHLPLGALLTSCHLAALALCVARLPVADAMKVAALPSLAWVLPALLPEGLARRALLGVLDAGRHLDFPLERPATPAHRVTSCLPILGLFVLPQLLSRPALDALRRPR